MAPGCRQHRDTICAIVAASSGSRASWFTWGLMNRSARGEGGDLPTGGVPRWCLTPNPPATVRPMPRPVVPDLWLSGEITATLTAAWCGGVSKRFNGVGTPLARGQPVTECIRRLPEPCATTCPWLPRRRPRPTRCQAAVLPGVSKSFRGSPLILDVAHSPMLQPARRSASTRWAISRAFCGLPGVPLADQGRPQAW